MKNFFKTLFNFSNKKSNHNKNDISSSQTQKIILASYNEVCYVTKILLKHKRIIIDLTKLEKSDRRRTVDFLSGVVFVNNGKAFASNKNKYIFTIEK